MASENRFGWKKTNIGPNLLLKRNISIKTHWIRTEVNLRVDKEAPELVMAFCEGLGYSKNFSIDKACDIYFFDDADIVYYSVKDEDGKYSDHLEIEADEDSSE